MSRASELSPVKRQLLARLMQSEGVGVEPRPVIERRPRGAPCPLSYAQNRVWFYHLLEPDSPSYNMAGGVHLKGRLSVWALAQSLNEVVRRHEILRTRFEEQNGQPVQVIADAQPLEPARHDLRDLPEPEREAAMQRLISEVSLRPFDLRNGPLLRVALVQLKDDEHALLVTMHHIASDGWSIGVFIKEAAAFYTAFVSEQPVPLAELPVQYADYAIWQRTWLSEEVLGQQVRYWKEQLGGRLPVLELPADRPRPPVQTYRGATLHFTIPEGSTAALKALSQSEGVTLFMLLLAAFQALLYRYTGEDDVVVGTPIANRTRREVEGLIGFFVNTLVLRTKLGGDLTFRQLLGRVREVCLGAYAHQDMPFEKLVEVLKPVRDMSRSPVFQVMFILQNAPLPPLQLPDLVLRELPIDSGTAKFDIELAMEEADANIVGHYNYNTDLFNAATVCRMAEHLKSFLASVAANPDQRLLDFTFSWTEQEPPPRSAAGAKPRDQFVFEL